VANAEEREKKEIIPFLQDSARLCTALKYVYESNPKPDVIHLLVRHIIACVKNKNTWLIDVAVATTLVKLLKWVEPEREGVLQCFDIMAERLIIQTNMYLDEYMRVWEFDRVLRSMPEQKYSEILQRLEAETVDVDEICKLLWMLSDELVPRSRGYTTNFVTSTLYEKLKERYPKTEFLLAGKELDYRLLKCIIEVPYLLRDMGGSSEIRTAWYVDSLGDGKVIETLLTTMYSPESWTNTGKRITCVVEGTYDEYKVKGLVHDALEKLSK
jgi:hypothetical protein